MWYVSPAPIPGPWPALPAFAPWLAAAAVIAAGAVLVLVVHATMSLRPRRVPGGVVELRRAA